MSLFSLHRERLLSSRVFNFYQDLLSSSILDLRKLNIKNTVANARCRIADAESPAQRHDTTKLTETAFGAMVRDDSSAIGPSFLFTPNAELSVGQSDLDLVG